MREKIDIRCSTQKVFEPFVKTYPDFKQKWLAYNDYLTTIIRGYLNDPDFNNFLSYLRTKIDYAASYLKREYDQQELLTAEMLKIEFPAAFEPTGEEVGTQYDYPCPICKAGREVKGNLILNLSRVPRGKDFAKTIAQDEWIISERLATLIQSENITGLELKLVQHYSRHKLKAPWYQMIIDSTVVVHPMTKYGDAFRPDLDVDMIKSSCGHTIKHLIYSELFLKRETWDNSDIAKTNYYFGGHLNLIYPWPAILLSQRFYQLLKKYNIKGYEIELAHLV